MEKYCQQIVLKTKEEETNEEFFKRVGNQLQILLEEGYYAVVRYDEPGLGIVVIEFEHDEYLDYWGCNRPMWVTEEEAEKILRERYPVKEDEEE